MKTIIIEDEVNVRNVLKKILKIIAPKLEIIGESGNVKEAVSLIKNSNPDLIFLDIELEDGTGFDVLNLIESNTAKIVFTTAYSEYAVKAFKYSAIDYLLKPIDPEELEETLKRVRFSIKTEKEQSDLLKILRDNLQKKETKIVLKTSSQRYILKVSEIVRLEADGAYTLFVTKNDKIIISKNLKYYQDLLDDNVFFRCHQSHLININNVESINNKGSLVMVNKDVVSVATRKKKEIKSKLSNLNS